jgi:hypothetical protein
VTTKCYDVRDAVKGISLRLTKDAVVVFLSNGMGYHEGITPKVRKPHIGRTCRLSLQSFSHPPRGSTRLSPHHLLSTLAYAVTGEGRGARHDHPRRHPPGGV